MANVPTLSVLPQFPIKETILDTVLKTTPEAGPVHTRQRYTNYKRTFVVSYANLSANDMSLLMTHQTTGTSGTAESFSWTHPRTSNVYTVRYAAPFEISTDYYGDTYRGSCEFTLNEV